jgi:hypothetical protein
MSTLALKQQVDRDSQGLRIRHCLVGAAEHLGAHLNWYCERSAPIPLNAEGRSAAHSLARFLTTPARWS